MDYENRPNIVIWRCSECGATKEGGMRPPEGWLEISFWNGVRFIRYAFCSYSCTSIWSGKRYDAQPKEVR